MLQLVASVCASAAVLLTVASFSCRDSVQQPWPSNVQMADANLCFLQLNSVQGSLYNMLLLW